MLFVNLPDQCEIASSTPGLTILRLIITIYIYPNQKHPWCKKSCGQELEKGLDEKEVKSKMGGRGLCSATTDQNKILIITSQAAKHYVIITW